jgi:hypothetical protein
VRIWRIDQPRSAPRFIVDARETFDEVHCNVDPNHQWYFEGLDKAGVVEVFCLISLVGGAGAHKVSDDCTAARHMEVGSQAMQNLSDAFVTRTMGCREHLLEAR